MNKERQVERKIGDKWLLLDGLKALKKGHVFRMFEPDGELVFDDMGRSTFKASGEAYWSDTHNTWMVDIETTYLH
jgi:hypothetical protein